MRTIEQLRAYAGNAPINAMRNRPFFHVASFTNNIAANGGSATVNIQIPQDYNFVVKGIVPTFWIAAAMTTAVIGTPFADGSNPTTSQNDFPNYSMLSLQIQTDINFFEQPIRLSALGDGTSYQRFLEDPFVFAAGQNVQVTVQHNGPAAMAATQGQIIFMGFRVYS